MASVRGGHGDRDDPRGRPPRSQIGKDEAEADHQKQADRPEQDGRQDRPHGGGQGRRRGKEAAEGQFRRSGVGQAGDDDGQDDRRQPYKSSRAGAPTQPRPSRLDHVSHNIYVMGAWRSGGPSRVRAPLALRAMSPRGPRRSTLYCATTARCCPSPPTPPGTAAPFPLLSVAAVVPPGTRASRAGRRSGTGSRWNAAPRPRSDGVLSCRQAQR